MESSWTAIHPSTLCEVLADPLDFLKVEARPNFLDVYENICNLKNLLLPILHSEIWKVIR